MPENTTSLDALKCTMENSAGLWAGSLCLEDSSLRFTADGKAKKVQSLNYSLSDIRRIRSLAGRNLLLVDTGNQTVVFSGDGINQFGLNTIDLWNGLHSKDGAFPLQFEHLRASAGAVTNEDEETETIRAKELCLRVSTKGYSPGLFTFTNQWVGFCPTDARGEPRGSYEFKIGLNDVQGVKVIRERNETVVQTGSSYERLVGDGAVRLGDRLRVILGNRLPSSTLMRLRAIATTEVPLLEDLEEEEHLEPKERILAEGRCIGRAGQLSVPGTLYLTPKLLRFIPEENDMWGSEEVWEKSLDSIEKVSVLGADRAVFWISGEAFRFLGREANKVGTKLVTIRGLSLSEDSAQSNDHRQEHQSPGPPDWPDAAIVPFERVLGLAHTLEVFMQGNLAFASRPSRLKRIDDGVGILLPEAPHSSLSWGEELRVQLFRDDGRYYFDAPLIRTGLAPRGSVIGEKPAWYMLTIQEGFETRFSNLRSSERVALDNHLAQVRLSNEKEQEPTVLEASLVNLSAGGCLVRNDISIAIGQNIGLVFELSDGPIEVEAECLRSMRPRRRDDPWHCAFVFVDMNDSDQARISSFVEALVDKREEA